MKSFLTLHHLLSYHKAPTNLWLDDDKKFRAFGLDAKFGYMQDDYDDHGPSLFFSNYKLALIDAFEDPLVRCTMIHFF